VTRELSIQDVASIIERVPDLSGMMLVGGQALNYWAETLGIADARSTGIYGPATSEDIDIMGRSRRSGRSPKPWAANRISQALTIRIAQIPGS